MSSDSDPRLITDEELAVMREWLGDEHPPLSVKINLEDAVAAILERNPPPDPEAAEVERVGRVLHEHGWLKWEAADASDRAMIRQIITAVKERES